jgi:two-component system sensor histidine kinase KdpD
VAFAVHGEDDVEPVARSGTGSFDLAMVRRVAREGIDIGERPDGTVVQRMPTAATLNEADRSWSDGGFDGSALRSLWLPLRVRDRIVGVLGASCQTTLALDDTHWRFAHALRFYAALALERVRLVAATEHAEAMRETDRLRNALLASVSHDLRTPLTTIKALAQESVTQRDPELALANALVIEEHADRLARVVSNVLDVTRLRAKTMPVHIEFNTAEDLVGAVARQCAGVLGDHPLERRIDEDGGLLAGSFDFVQSLRVLTNLVENAARYSPPGAPVTLSARRDGAQVVFEVADRGPGVPPLQRERIFEPFYRLPGAAPDIGGTGLGLYIARGLAEAQGGTVTYAPRLPHGSVFTLHLPAIDIGETVPNDAEEREEIT